MKIKIVHIIEDVRQDPPRVVQGGAFRGVTAQVTEPVRQRLSPRVIMDKTRELFEAFPNIPWELKDNSSHHLVYVAECDADLLLDAKQERSRPMEVHVQECRRPHLATEGRIGESRRRIADNPQA